MKISRKILLISSACLSSMMAVQGVAAQEVAKVPAAEAEDPGLGEIVVTARKRQESIMNVPVVTTAVSGEMLERFNTADLKSLATMVPGLSVGGSILSVGTLVSLRGVGTSALDPGVDASVALNIDGMALSQGLAYASGMFDVGSIEVLKGPQALFYGKSSPGGVISLRSADPKDHLELIGRAGYEFEARERRIELIVSGPLTDTLKVRLAGTTGKQDGFFYNDAVGIPSLGGAGPSSRRLGPITDYKLRGTILFNPSEAFDVRLKINRVFDDTNYSAIVQNTICPDGTGPYLGRQFLDPNDKCKLDRHASIVDFNPVAFPGVPNNGVPYNKVYQTYGTAEVNFHLQPDLTLTSQTGYYLVNANSLYVAAVGGAGVGLFNAINDFQRRQFTQETRLTSDFDSPINFTLGGFFERGRFYDAVTIAGNTFLGSAVLQQRGRKTVHIKTESAFGQLLYKIIPEIEVAAGSRWTNERRNQEGINTISGTPVPIVLAVPAISAKNLAPELSITYRPTPDFTVFGSLKRAYKSGSFNVATAPTTGENNAFGDERVQGGEFGIKSRSSDRRLLFNAAVFYYKYAGLQVGANTQSSGGVSATRTVNAGAARAYGVEADISYRPDSIDGLNLRAGGLWNNTKYTTLINVPCYGGQMISEGCNLVPRNASLPASTFGTVANPYTSQDRSGVPLVRAPKFSGTFGFDYTIPVGDLTVVIANNNQYQSKSLVNLGYVYYQKAYIKADLSLTLKGPDNRWEFGLVGKNLNNEITSGNCSNSNRQAGNTGGVVTGTATRGAAGTDEVGCWADRGRELWLRATLRY